MYITGPFEISLVFSLRAGDVGQHGAPFHLREVPAAHGRHRLRERPRQHGRRPRALQHQEAPPAREREGGGRCTGGTCELNKSYLTS